MKGTQTARWAPNERPCIYACENTDNEMKISIPTPIWKQRTNTVQRSSYCWLCWYICDSNLWGCRTSPKIRPLVEWGRVRAGERHGGVFEHVLAVISLFSNIIQFNLQCLKSFVFLRKFKQGLFTQHAFNLHASRSRPAYHMVPISLQLPTVSTDGGVTDGITMHSIGEVCKRLPHPVTVNLCTPAVHEWRPIF